MKADGKWAAAATGALIAVCLVTSLPARSLQGRNTLALGYVDLQKVSDEVKKTREWQQAVADAIKQTEDLNRQLRDLEELRYLTEAERRELQMLEGKVRTTEQEQERIAQLRRKSASIDEEFQALALLTNATDEQKNRIRELAAIRDQGRRAVEQARREMQSRVDALQRKLVNDAQTRVLKLVSEVAQQRNLELVLDRDAVLYGGQDITDGVLRKLAGR